MHRASLTGGEKPAWLADRRRLWLLCGGRGGGASRTGRTEVTQRRSESTTGRRPSALSMAGARDRPLRRETPCDVTYARQYRRAGNGISAGERCVPITCIISTCPAIASVCVRRYVRSFPAGAGVLPTCVYGRRTESCCLQRLPAGCGHTCAGTATWANLSA